MDAASDERATRMVLAGEMLPGDGDYFFVVDQGEAVVVRKCGNTVVARVPMENVGRIVVQAGSGEAERPAADRPVRLPTIAG